jgi:hypothetical protein
MKPMTYLKWNASKYSEIGLTVIDGCPSVFCSERMKTLRLYQHTARCQAAILKFLCCNPHYWCFIPQRWNESMTTSFNCMGEPLRRESEVDQLVENGVIEHHRVARYLHRVPLPPAQFVFSSQQRQEQRIFFRNLVQGV